MATIKSQMALDDGMSRVLSKIVNGLNTTLDAFEQVQRASGSALDVANIEAARAGLAEAGAEVPPGGRTGGAAEQRRQSGRIRHGWPIAQGCLPCRHLYEH